VPTVRRSENRCSDPPASSSPQASERRRPLHRHVFSSLTAVPRFPVAHITTSLPSQRRLSAPTVRPQIAETSNDALRISTPSFSPPSSISDSTWRTLRLSHIRNGRDGNDYEEFLGVRPQGDRNYESELYALLNTPDDGRDEDDDPNTGSSHGDYAYRPPHSRSINRSVRPEDDNEVDELEFDCISTHTSRSTSPVSSQFLDYPPSGPAQSRSYPKKVLLPEIGYRDDLDIAGTCFDPTNGYIYVASEESVVEWSLRDADKRWWLESSWR